MKKSKQHKYAAMTNVSVMNGMVFNGKPKKIDGNKIKLHGRGETTYERK